MITEERIEQLAYEFVNDSDGTLGAMQNALRNAAEESDRATRQECAEKGINDGKWQSIETAPKDGTVIELMNEHNGLTDIGHWCDYSTRGYPSLSELDGEWDQEQGNGDMTHWRPLASPPEATKEPTT